MFEAYNQLKTISNIKNTILFIKTTYVESIFNCPCLSKTILKEFYGNFKSRVELYRDYMQTTFTSTHLKWSSYCGLIGGPQKPALKTVSCCFIVLLHLIIRNQFCNWLVALFIVDKQSWSSYNIRGPINLISLIHIL